MKITDLSVYRVSGKWTGSDFPSGSCQSNPLDIYPEFNVSGGGGDEKRERISALYLEIEAEGGVTGLFGPIQETQAFVILKQLRSFLIGRDALATELLLDQMIRLDRIPGIGLYGSEVVFPPRSRRWEGRDGEESGYGGIGSRCGGRRLRTDVRRIRVPFRPQSPSTCCRLSHAATRSTSRSPGSSKAWGSMASCVIPVNATMCVTV